FINDEKTMGFWFLCQPLYGADGQVEERMKSFLNTDFPAGTILSILWFRSPDIVRQMAEMKMLRDETGYRNPLMEAVINERAEFLERGTLSPVDKHMGQLFYDLRIVITVKMPIQEQFPTREDEIKIATYQKKVRSSLATIGMRPEVLDPDRYLRVISSLVNWGETASWRQGPVTHERNKPLCEQILDFDKDITVDRGHLKIGETFVKMLSAKRLPESFYFGDALKYAGDLRGGNVALKQQYAICCNIYYPDSEKEKHTLERKRGLA